MPRQLDPLLREVLEKHGEDPRDTKGVVWDCHGTWVIYHRALERVAARAGIRSDAPLVLEANGPGKCAALCVTAHLADRSDWSIGEAAPGNNKNSYPFAMAEKRARDRVILKLIGLSGLAYSEEEADDFKSTPANDASASSEANRLIKLIKESKTERWLENVTTAPANLKIYESLPPEEQDRVSDFIAGHRQTIGRAA